MPPQTTVLITGASRGIGHGLVTLYLTRRNHTIIALVRDVTNETSKSLSSLPKEPSSTLITVECDLSTPTSIKTAISTLKTSHNISEIQIAIPNAALSEFYGPILSTPIEGMRLHYETNVLGNAVLYQEIYSLLKPRQDGTLPKWMAISSTVGSIGLIGKVPVNGLMAYGSSKAALNWLTRGIHEENGGVVAFVVHPGWVRTDAGNKGAKQAGLEQAPLGIQECCELLVGLVDEAGREKCGGRFFDNETREEIPW